MAAEQHPPLGPEGPDLLASVIRASLGAIPAIGPALAEIFVGGLRGLQAERMERLLIALNRKVHDLDQQIPTERHTAERADIIREGGRQAAQAVYDERIERIASIMAHSLTEGEMKHEQTMMLFRLLDQVSDAEMIVLQSELHSYSWQQRPEFYEKHAAILDPPRAHLQSSDDELDASAVWNARQDNLLGLGLLKPSSSGGDYTEVTRLGRMLLFYAGMIGEDDY